MNENKIEEIKYNNYEVDDIAKFLGLTPEEAERIEEMILKARLEWIMDKG
jgi:hypothetical protein